MVFVRRRSDPFILRCSVFEVRYFLESADPQKSAFKALPTLRAYQEGSIWNWDMSVGTAARGRRRGTRESSRARRMVNLVIACQGRYSWNYKVSGKILHLGRLTSSGDGDSWYLGMPD